MEKPSIIDLIFVKHNRNSLCRSMLAYIEINIFSFKYINKATNIATVVLIPLPVFLDFLCGA